MFWGMLILGGVVGLIVIAVLLKILSKHFVAILVTSGIASAGIIISSFAMPHVERGNQLNWGWIIAQTLFIFLFCVIFCAGFAFDEEEYEHTERNVTPKIFGGYRVDEYTRMESKTVFWSVLGGGFGVAVVLVFLNYIIFEKHAIALGVVGCLALCLTLVLLLRFFLARRKRRSYY